MLYITKYMTPTSVFFLVDDAFNLHSGIRIFYVNHFVFPLAGHGSAPGGNAGNRPFVSSLFEF